MPVDTPVNGHGLRVGSESERLLSRLEDPRTAAAMNSLLDNIELLAVLVQGVDGLARKGEVIGDTIAEVLHEAKAAGRATGMDPIATTQQLATLIPTLAHASPTIERILGSPIVDEQPLEILGELAVALSEGCTTARQTQPKVGLRGLLKATRDDDIQRGLGFILEVAKAFGRDLAKRGASAA